jgi:hypothetical protein
MREQLLELGERGERCGVVGTALEVQRRERVPEHVRVTLIIARWI